jgi:hypothetical protein
MLISRSFVAMFMSILLITSFACQNKAAEKESNNSVEGEEPGLQIAKNDTYDSVKKGVRLILSYDSTSSSFNGTIENVTNETIKYVRVEVHLSNGIELGPTKPIDLAPENKEDVMLSAEGQSFDWWKAHPEAGEGEHESGHEGEHNHEQGEEHEHDEEH